MPPASSSQRLLQQAARLSIATSVAVFGIKLAGYGLTGSVGILSDALESTVNIAASLLVALSLRFAALPADDNHPYGHTKAEYISSFLEGLLIGVAAVLIVQASVSRLLRPQALELNWWGLGLTALASGLNLLVGLYLMRRGRAHRSVALEADGQHFVSDVYSSLAVLAGVVLALLSDWTWLDPVIGLFVAVGLLLLGWRVVRRALSGLMDEGLPAGEVEAVRAAIEGRRARFIEYHDLRTRRAGRESFVDFHLILPRQLSLEEAHAVCDDIERAIEVALPGTGVTIHVEPEEFAHGLPSAARLDVRL